VKVIAEPGRFLVSDAGYFVCRIMGTATRANKHWMHLDAGLFGGIMRQPKGSSTRSEPTRRTGHSLERCRTHLRFDRRGDARRAAPSDLQEGDYIYLKNAGAYTTAYASKFNGSRCPKIRVI